MSDKKYVVLSTPTSATGSLWRLCSFLAPNSVERVKYIDKEMSKGVTAKQMREAKIKDAGLYLFNSTGCFNFDQDLSDFWFVVNFRDPRDLLCNQYWWKFSHPNFNKTHSELEVERERLKDAGIDSWVLDQDVAPLFYGIEKFYKLFYELGGRSIVVSYPSLCFETSAIIDKLAEFFQYNGSGLNDLKLKEHPSSLSDNPRWVAGTWVGADLAPGRAKVELKDETYSILTDRYARILRVLSELDGKNSYFYDMK